QCVSEAQSLAHAERVRADTRPGRRLVEADELQQRVDALRRHAHGVGGDGERFAAAAPGVLGGRVEQDADAPSGIRQVAVAPAEYLDVAAVGLGEADEHAHGGGLAGAVGAEKSRDGARLAAERDVRDDAAPAELLGESAGLDHADRLAGRQGLQPRSAGYARRALRRWRAATLVGGRGRRVGLALTLERWHARLQHALPMACPAGCAPRCPASSSRPATRSVVAATESSTRRSTWARSRSAPPPSRSFGKCTRPGCASWTSWSGSRRSSRCTGGAPTQPPSGSASGRSRS